MSETAGEQLHHLCVGVFGSTMPFGYIMDGNKVLALNPSHDYFHITRSQGGYFTVYWLSPNGEGDWFYTTPSHLKAQEDPTDHEVLPPPAEALEALAKALPLPTYRVWGVLEAGQPQEIVLFNNLQITEPPDALFTVTRGRRTHLRSQLYDGDDWLDMRAFWNAVRTKKLVNLTPYFGRNARRFQWGKVSDEVCVLVNDVVFARPAMWDRSPTLAAADLRGLKDLPRV